MRNYCFLPELLGISRTMDSTLFFGIGDRLKMITADTKRIITFAYNHIPFWNGRDLYLISQLSCRASYCTSVFRVLRPWLVISCFNCSFPNPAISRLINSLPKIFIRGFCSNTWQFAFVVFSIQSETAFAMCKKSSGCILAFIKIKYWFSDSTLSTFDYLHGITSSLINGKVLPRRPNIYHKLESKNFRGFETSFNDTRRQTRQMMRGFLVKPVIWYQHTRGEGIRDKSLIGVWLLSLKLAECFIMVEEKMRELSPLSKPSINAWKARRHNYGAMRSYFAKEAFCCKFRLFIKNTMLKTEGVKISFGKRTRVPSSDLERWFREVFHFLSPWCFCKIRELTTAPSRRAYFLYRYYIRSLPKTFGHKKSRLSGVLSARCGVVSTRVNIFNSNVLCQI